ncbi:longitudinals lacking protein, isoforms A/B/D/L isoform X5 [Lucilia cuprina]|uniref:longitudinals lacking protein, isoforms A/B/D/L isoform X5 n=1 Tax=Lucilia cuprina TaxID=7375 RepID=UPI001F066142|nr:longitudinals lacking protein, isoforms A/B/D/L isoform X5 [Lucilia cuprina]
MDDDQQFCLRWNNHQSTLISVFDTLLENETLVDCTLAAEGKFLKAHKVVLSACSPYFATLLQEQYDKHPIFILKDVKYQELRAMMDYMYRGEVNISQDQLAALLKAAESLQIKGLSDNRSGGGTTAPKPEHHRATMPTGKLSAGYTLEQTKRARIAGPAEPEMGSREGSSSPSRRRRKVRRRSIENAMTDVHDNSNSSQQQTQSNASGLGAITAAASALAAAAAAAPNTQSLASNVPLSASTSSSTAVTAPGTTLSSSKKTDIVKGTTQQQQQTQQDAMNTDNVQGPASAATATGSIDTETTDSAAAVASTATDKSNHKQLQQQLKQAKESISGNAAAGSGSELVIEPKAEYDDEANDEPVEDLTLDEEDMGMDDLDQNAGTSQGGEGSSQGYAPWQHDRSQDELLLATQEAQQRDPQGSSSTESYWTIVETVPYTLANSQTNGGGTAAVTNVISTHSHQQHHQVQQHNTTNIHHHQQQQQQHQQPAQQQQQQQQHHHHPHQQHVATTTDPSSLIASATVVVEIPSDTVGMPGSTIHYTLPKGTATDHQQILRNVQTSTALTAAYTKLTNPPTTIQIVKHSSNSTRINTPETIIPDVQPPAQVQHQQVQHITLQECLDATNSNVLQQHHHAPAQHIQQTTTATVTGNGQNHNNTQIQQEYIKIDTSRFEDKMLLRNVVQYEQQQQQQQQQHHQTVSISTAPTTTTAATQATIIVNETVAKEHLHHHQHHQQQQQQQEQMVHVQQQQEQQHQQQQHEQLLAESVTTSASEADDLEDLTELKPLSTNLSVTVTTHNNSNLLVAPPSSHHDTSESDNEKFLTPPKRIKTGILKPSDIAAAGLQYVCNVCGKSYKIKGSLKRHKSYECGVAPGLSCPYCPHKCKYKSDLRKHISQKHALSITTTSNNITM